MKKPFIYLLTAGLALSMIVNTESIEGATSEANVTFTVPETTEPVAPLDPTNPEVELENPGEVTGETGPLTLDYISTLQFGPHTLVLEDNNALAIESETLNPSLQVSDRRHTGEGWNVVATLGNFTDTATNEQSLQGATISLDNGSAVTPIAGLSSPTVYTPIELTSNATPIVSANSKDETGVLKTAQGLGTWVTSWLSEGGDTNNNVVLNIPARTATAGSHTAVITWELTNGPYN